MKRFATMAAIPAALLVGVTALAASGMTALPVGIGMTAIAAEPVKTGQDAFGDWHDDAPGVKRLFKAEDMPAPAVVEQEAASNGPDEVPRPDAAKPDLPEGFSAEMIASGIENPRVVRVAPNGDLFVADSKANQIRVYRLAEGGADLAGEDIFATDLHRPYGIAFYPLGDNPEWVYVANDDSVVRFPYKSGDMKASGEPELIVDHIPGLHHWTRDLVFSADGKTMYLSVGSGSNIALDMSPEPMGGLEEWNKSHPVGATWDTEEKRADVLAFDPDGKNERIFATGLRNCSGMTLEPTSQALWCVVNERDLLGDDVPFEYATSVKEGGFYGWPWYYIGANEDPRRTGERPDLRDKVTVPDVLMQPHSAPLNIAFYQGENFPDEYKGDAFVTMHGSWNRGVRTGYKVVRLHFDNGKPTGEYEDFMTGFVVSDEEVWGRPVGVAVAKDGSLIVTEDGSGTIWRVTYEANRS
jgi:glucose/arabinose dehydrogenase